MKQKRKALTGQQTRVTNKTRTPMNCTWEAFANLHNGSGNTNGKHHTLLFCKLRSLKFQAQDKHNEHMHRHDLGQRQRAVQGGKRLVRWSEFGPQGSLRGCRRTVVQVPRPAGRIVDSDGVVITDVLELRNAQSWWIPSLE